MTTDPPGALVWQVDDRGRQKLGTAPIEIERSYVDRYERDWLWPFILTLDGLIIGGVGFAILENSSYSYSGPDDAETIPGYTTLALGGVSLLIGLIWSIAVAVDPTDVADGPEPYTLQASMAGFEDTSDSFSLGFAASTPNPPPLDFHINLLEKWRERYGIKPPSEKLSAAAVPPLRRALSDEKAIVREEAAQALAEIGPAAKVAIAELIVLMGDGDAEIRRAAILALEAIRLPEARVIESLKRTFEYDASDSVREVARHALQKLSLLRISVAEPEAKVPVKEIPVAVEIVAVTDVFDASGKFKEDTLVQLTTYLGTALTRTGKYQLIPRDQLRASLAEQKKESYRECMDQSCQIQLGRSVSASKLLSTQLLQVGNKCAATANLYDLKTETTQKGAMVQTGCSPDELLDAMQKIADQL
ncbi:MAG: hypothetical protein JRF33_24825 [Deltaproteobacteria bacterium]|nr:hypothetical protein [Deltaproteobacteria bacterium]